MTAGGTGSLGGKNGWFPNLTLLNRSCQDFAKSPPVEK